ncbi:MAG: phosphodiester glycosidase family protein [Candidatus Roizmanbacteria bacterium]
MRKFLLFILGSVFLSSLVIAIIFYKNSIPLPLAFQKTQKIRPTLSANIQKNYQTIVQTITGPVTVQHEGKSYPVITETVRTLVGGDIITTGKEAVATVDFGEGTVIRLAPETVIELKEAQKNIDSLSLTIGTIYGRFKKLVGIREGLEINTPSAIASVRGTIFNLWVNKEKSTKLIVLEHKVNLSSTTSSESAVIETNMQGIQSIASGSATVSPVSFSPEEDAWIKLNSELNTSSSEKDSRKKMEEKAQLFVTFINSITPTLTPAPTKIQPTKVPIQKLTTMPGIGHTRGEVETPTGNFIVSCIGANKSTTKVITDSASEDTCKNDCPVSSLDNYVSKNGGYAGINGMYFCPADYPDCTDKKNSFDTLFFQSNKKVYLNSENNIYSTIPFVVFNNDANPRFMQKSLEWGRDTNVMAGTAGNPMLVFNGQANTSTDGLVTKQTVTKSNRGAIVEKDANIYLCIVEKATVPDASQVFGILGATNALNIDGGGSSALYFNGRYLYGPGRQIPTAIIFANR